MYKIFNTIASKEICLGDCLKEFSGRVCLVIGGSGGVGEALVEILVERGCTTIFTYAANAAKALGIVERLRGSGSIEAVRLDATDYRDAQRVAEYISKKHGSLNHLAVLHGLSRADLWKASWDSLSLEDYLEVFRVDFGGFFNVVKAFKNLLERSSPASLVAISSTPALVGDIEGYPYLAAKAAVAAFAKSLAYTLAPRVRVNIAALGSIETKWIEWLDEKTIERIKASIPLKRIGKPREAAEAIAFLLSDRSSYITGQVLIVDGGEVVPT